MVVEVLHYWRLQQLVVGFEFLLVEMEVKDFFRLFLALEVIVFFWVLVAFFSFVVLVVV